MDKQRTKTRTLIEIQERISSLQYSELQEAIDKCDRELIRTLLHRDLRKREAERYYPKIIEELPHISRLASKKYVAKWDKQKIISYLADKLDRQDLDEVITIINGGQLDLC